MTYKSKVGYSSTAGYASSVGYESSSGFEPISTPSVFDRVWTIGNIGDDYGYHVPNAYGGLVSNEWFNYIDTVDVLIVDDSANAVIFQSSIMSMWGIETEVTINVEGFGQTVLTWNGATAYVNVGETAFVAYIVSQLGNSIGVTIFPLNIVPKTSNNTITTLLEPEITTLGDNIVHTES